MLPKKYKSSIPSEGKGECKATYSVSKLVGRSNPFEKNLRVNTFNC